MFGCARLRDRSANGPDARNPVGQRREKGKQTIAESAGEPDALQTLRDL
jgi:hypothetical protein